MTSKYMHKLPTPAEHETTTWTYWITRDSLDGALSAKCTLWNERPLRVHVKTRVVWVDGPAPNGHLGEFRPDEIHAWFRTCPETDREIVCVQTRPSASELDDAQRKQGLK